MLKAIAADNSVESSVSDFHARLCQVQVHLCKRRSRLDAPIGFTPQPAAFVSHCTRPFALSNRTASCIAASQQLSEVTVSTFPVLSMQASKVMWNGIVRPIARAWPCVDFVMSNLEPTAHALVPRELARPMMIAYAQLQWPKQLPAKSTITVICAIAMEEIAQYGGCGRIVLHRAIISSNVSIAQS